MTRRSAAEAPPPCPGRERELRSLLSRLQSGRGGPPGSTLVVGAPGFGKTAFLDHVSAAGRRSAMAELSSQLVFCPLRVPPTGALDERVLLGMMHRALDGDVVVEPVESCTEAELERALQRSIEERGRAHVFLIDDFHRVSQSAEFSAPFFSFLRYLGYNLSAGYLLTSRLDIGEMAVRQEVQASPFWNIFSKIRMGPLRDEQAVRVLTERVGRQPGLGDEHLRAAAPLADGVPFLIQATAEALREMATGDVAWDGGTLLARVLQRSRGTLDELWEGIRPSGRQALAAHLGPRETSAGQRDLLLPFVDLGLLDDDLRVRGLALAWDWTLRAGLDPETVACPPPELPPRRRGLIGRWLRRDRREATA